MIATDGPVIKFPPLPTRVPITIDELDKATSSFRDKDDPATETWRKTIVDPETGHACFYVHFAPNQAGGPHWHPSNTIYFITKGSLIVEAEGEYKAGDVRLVQGGFAYRERGGPEGCEFLFVSLGTYGRFDPDIDPPPVGRWDQPA